MRILRWHSPLPRKQGALCIRESDALPPKSLLQHLVLGLEELDHDELPAMHPARHDHQ